MTMFDPRPRKDAPVVPESLLSSQVIIRLDDAVRLLEQIPRTDDQSLKGRLVVSGGDSKNQWPYYQNTELVFLDPANRLRLAYSLSPEFSKSDPQAVCAELSNRIFQALGEGYRATVVPTNFYQLPTIEIHRRILVEGFPMEEKVAELEYVPLSVIEFKFLPERSSVLSAEALQREGTAALTILKCFIESHSRVLNIVPKKEVLELSFGGNIGEQQSGRRGQQPLPGLVPVAQAVILAGYIPRISCNSEHRS